MCVSEDLLKHESNRSEERSFRPYITRLRGPKSTKIRGVQKAKRYLESKI